MGKKTSIHPATQQAALQEDMASAYGYVQQHHSRNHLSKDEHVLLSVRVNTLIINSDK